MDQFSIPERLDPVSRAENQGHNTVPSDRRARRQSEKPSRSRPQDETDNLSADDEESRNLDELA